MILCDGPWRLDVNLKHLGIPGEERKLSYQEKNTSILLCSNTISQVVSTACSILDKSSDCF